MDKISYLLLVIFSTWIMRPDAPETVKVGWNCPQYQVCFDMYEDDIEPIPLVFSDAHQTSLTTSSAYIRATPTPKPKTIYEMNRSQLNRLSVAEKAKLVNLSVKDFKMMAEVISHEAGTQMNDKILVAAVIWNRTKCKQFNNSVKGVITAPGQFYDLSQATRGTPNDKKAQLAILLAYKSINKGKIPHNVLYFNSIGYRSKNPKRYRKYKHFANYFLKDTKCKCYWCKHRSAKLR